MTDLHAASAVVTGVIGLATGPLVPTLIARIPELEPEEPEDGEEPPEPPSPPEPFADVAQRPGLAWKSAVASAVAAAIVGLVVGWAWPLLYLVPLVPVGVALAAVDWRTRILPTWLIRPTFLGTLVLVVVTWLLAADLSHPAPLVRAAIGCVVTFVVFFVLWFVYPRGMGYGDVRLSGTLGLALGYLGWGQLVVGVYGGFLLGAVVGGLLALLRVVDRKGYPFGPFMLVGALVGIALGQPIVSAIYG